MPHTHCLAALRSVARCVARHLGSFLRVISKVFEPIEGFVLEGSIEGFVLEGSIEGFVLEGSIEGLVLEGSIEGFVLEGSIEGFVRRICEPKNYWSQN